MLHPHHIWMMDYRHPPRKTIWAKLFPKRKSRWVGMRAWICFYGKTFLSKFSLSAQKKITEEKVSVSNYSIFITMAKHYEENIKKIFIVKIVQSLHIFIQFDIINKRKNISSTEIHFIFVIFYSNSIFIFVEISFDIISLWVHCTEMWIWAKNHQ